MHSLSKIIGVIGDAAIPTAAPHFIRNVFAVGCALLVASAVAGTILWIPYTRRIMSDGAVRREKRMHRQTDDAAFDAMFWDEYDAMMVPGTGPAGSAGAEDLVPVSVSTPRGDVAMAYVPSRGAFGYYTDRRGSITYAHLETVARKFLLHHARPDLAKLAYADRRLKMGEMGGERGRDCCDGDEAILVPAVPAVPVEPIAPVPAVQGIFARLRSYNRKPSASSVASASASDSGSASASAVTEPPLDYTRFVWLGTLHDLMELSEASKPSTDYERVDYDYAEFKRLHAVQKSSASSAPVTDSDIKASSQLDELDPVPSATSATSATTSDSSDSD